MKKKLLIAFGVIIILFIGYLLLPSKTCKTPDSAITLNLDYESDLEKDFDYLNEDNFIDTMNNVVTPYLYSFVIDDYFEGYDGNLLHYKSYINNDSKAHIVIFHGYTNFADKFNEIIYYFLKSGYSVSILESRGHGYSYRAVSDLSKVTINDFSEYVKDFEIFIDDIVMPTIKEDEQLFAYSHSMGGAIATLYMIDHPDTFDCAILSSPMMEVLFGGIPNNVVDLIINFSMTFGMKNNYILGNGPYDGTYYFDESSNLSKARYEYQRNLSLDDEYHQTNAGTYAWLNAAINATKEIANNASNFTVDSLLIQAENDTTVGASGQNYFVKNAKNVSMVIVPDATHNIFYSNNEIVYPYMDIVLEFYNSHVN